MLRSADVAMLFLREAVCENYNRKMSRSADVAMLFLQKAVCENYNRTKNVTFC